MMYLESSIKRILEHCSPESQEAGTPCLEWRGGTNGEGYGCAVVEGKKRLVHRVIYEQARGPIQRGLVLDHLCRNHRCVNVEHLEAVTIRVNVLRGERRQAAGGAA